MSLNAASYSGYATPYLASFWVNFVIPSTSSSAGSGRFLKEYYEFKNFS